MQTNQEKMRDIEIQIQKEQDLFGNSVYQGLIPADLIVYFKKALMKLAPTTHMLWNRTMRAIVDKNIDELTHNEVGLANNTITSVPFEALYKDLREALRKNEQFEALKIEYNMLVKKKQQEWNERKENLIALSGVNINQKQILRTVN